MYTQIGLVRAAIGLVRAAILSKSYEHDAAIRVTEVLSITTFRKFNHVYVPVIAFRQWRTEGGFKPPHEIPKF
jgi:hypothetical protein